VEDLNAHVDQKTRITDEHISSIQTILQAIDKNVTEIKTNQHNKSDIPEFNRFKVNPIEKIDYLSTLQQDPRFSDMDNFLGEVKAEREEDLHILCLKEDYNNNEKLYDEDRKFDLFYEYIIKNTEVLEHARSH